MRNAFPLMLQLSQSRQDKKKKKVPASRDALSGSPDCPLLEAALSSAHTARELESSISRGAREVEPKKGAPSTCPCRARSGRASSPPGPCCETCPGGAVVLLGSLPPSLASWTCLGWALPTVLIAAILRHILVSFPGWGEPVPCLCQLLVTPLCLCGRLASPLLSVVQTDSASIL